ncbi:MULTISPECIES: glycosyl hydrolase 53 family protein [unclassified Bacteroides]|uniref:glycosyl hydrolase 53 family protein n=1 Tax=unclassified Bacteroides TaxID=2646097 RepID=UPI0009DCA1D6|nr:MULTISPECIES: glycosyl hydrolase 53 family protein [unclassified Bacteroides]
MTRKLALSLALLCGMACAKAQNSEKYLGADISMLTAYETISEAGHQVTYKDIDGTQSDVLSLLKKYGMNSMRVRLFVNPTMQKAVIQDIDYVKKLGKRIKDAGLSFVLDFHYSDTWADPAAQSVPAEWGNLSVDEYTEKLYSYTKEVLEDFVNEGVVPDMIQTGNEISYGLMYSSSSGLFVDYLSDKNWDKFAAMLKSAGKACREVCPSAKIILHIERVPQPLNCAKFANYMKQYEVDYDIFGLSYYPMYHGNLAYLETALNKIEEATDKTIMIMETGYNTAYYPTDAKYDCQSIWPATESGQSLFIEQLVAKLNTHDRVKGLYYWFPEENESASLGWTDLLDGWTNRGLFNNKTGNAVDAITKFAAFNTTTTAVQNVSSTSEIYETERYDIQGRKIKNPTKGINIIKMSDNSYKKILVK